jgi:hypothetical protein
MLCAAAASLPKVSRIIRRLPQWRTALTESGEVKFREEAACRGRRHFTVRVQ